MENQTPYQNQNPGQNQNPNYGTNYAAPKNQSTVSIGDWIITLIILCIPLVNLIMLFVWAFGSSTPVSKANWAKAQLIFMLIGFILVIAFYGTIAALVVGAATMGS